MAGIGKIESVTSVFAGQGDLIIFDSVTDYSTATFGGLANPKSLGQIVQNSTSWAGEDPQTTQVKDEQGNIITALVTAGTLGFSFELASTSQVIVTKFLNGKALSELTNANIGTSITGVGFGTDLPIITAPLMILNDEKTRAWLYPKCKIVSNLSFADGIWRIKATVTCEYLKTDTLCTGMILDMASATYDTSGS